MYLTAEELSDEQRRLAEKLAASRGGRLVGPGAFWLRNPTLAAQADAWRLLMERRTSLPRRLSELAIIVANRHFTASYAWCRHTAAASRAGLARFVGSVSSICQGISGSFSSSATFVSTMRSSRRS